MAGEQSTKKIMKQKDSTINKFLPRGLSPQGGKSPGYELHWVQVIISSLIQTFHNLLAVLVGFNVCRKRKIYWSMEAETGSAMSA